MRKNNRGFSTFIISLLVMFLGIVGFYFYTRNPTLLPTPKPNFKTGIYGKVISDSDVQTIPDHPISDSLVVAIKSSDFESYYQNSDGILDDRVGNDQVSYAKTNSLGNYGIRLEPDDYTFCFTFKQADEHKHSLIDCVETKIEENELQKINISRSFDTQFSCITKASCTSIDVKTVSTNKTEGIKKDEKLSLDTNLWQEITFNGITFKIPGSCYQTNDVTMLCSIQTNDEEKLLHGNTFYLQVQDYQGGSRREQFDAEEGCNPLFIESKFGSIDALEIPYEAGQCQGIDGAIVAVVGNKLVSFINHKYDPVTKEAIRWDTLDTIVSTLRSQD